MLYAFLLTSLVGAVTALPNNALRVDRLALNQIDPTKVPVGKGIDTAFLPPGVTAEEAKAKPFHVYDDSFLDIIGENPTLNVVATTETDPIFHEAVVWVPETDEMFFVQNAGAPAAGTGLEKSNVINKIKLSEAQAIADGTNTTAEAKVTLVEPNGAPIINSNGATNFRGNLVFTGEGQGPNVAPTLYEMSPYEPYNSSVLISNFHGRQFNSLNDVVINPRNGEIYFTDSLYGNMQDYRPHNDFLIPTQVYRLNADTGAVSVVATDFDKPNGLTFSGDGKVAYVTDTGAQMAFYGTNSSAPSTIYRFDVEEDGTWSNRKTFAYASTGIPDGVHCDKKGNVYSGVGDGVHVWNPIGELIGKIYLGRFAANFRWASNGRMVIAAQTELYYATIAAEGTDPEDQFQMM